MKCCNIFCLGIVIGFFLDIYIRQMLKIEKYLQIKLMNGILYVWIYMAKGMGLTGILFCLCTSVLLVLSVTDLHTYEIPFGYNVMIGVCGVIRLMDDLAHWHVYVLGFFSVSVVLWVIYMFTRATGMGGGDVKLMAASGLLLGWKNNLLAFAIGSIAAVVIHPLLMKMKGMGRRLAFGPYLAFGIFVSMLYGN